MSLTFEEHAYQNGEEPEEELAERLALEEKCDVAVIPLQPSKVSWSGSIEAAPSALR